MWQINAKYKEKSIISDVCNEKMIFILQVTIKKPVLELNKTTSWSSQNKGIFSMSSVLITHSK